MELVSAVAVLSVNTAESGCSRKVQQPHRPAVTSIDCHKLVTCMDDLY